MGTRMSIIDPHIIPLERKKKFLAKLSEDEFRDKVVRPLYIAQGLIHGKDTCGPDEEGKDCYFWFEDPIRGRVLYCVQTKRGHLKLASKLRDNVTNALTQMRTALETFVPDSTTKTKVKPVCVMLVASGEINKSARSHITDSIDDPRIQFQDVNDIVNLVDAHFPELWNGIDAERLPYLKNLKDFLLKESSTLDISAIGLDTKCKAAITDDAYVQLFVNRWVGEGQKGREQISVEEIKAERLVDQREKMVLVIGGAGSGKTTALARIAFRLLQQALTSQDNKKIPVLISAPLLAEVDTAFIPFASESTKRFSNENTCAFEVEDLTSGNVVFLVDAIDEVAVSDKRESLCNKILEVREKYPACQVIATSRNYSFINELSQRIKATRYSLSQIGLKQAEKIIGRVAKGLSLSKVDTQETLRRLDNIHGLSLSPLLVTIFVASSEYNRTDIPANITELFKKFTEVMLGRWN